MTSPYPFCPDSSGYKHIADDELANLVPKPASGDIIAVWVPTGDNQRTKREAYYDPTRDGYVVVDPRQRVLDAIRVILAFEYGEGHGMNLKHLRAARKILEIEGVGDDL